MKYWLQISVIILLTLVSCQKIAEQKDKLLSKKDDLPAINMDQVKKLYNKAKENGEKVPKDMMEWAKEDLKKIGTFEYKIVTIKHQSDASISDTLNSLGNERWNCYWVERTPLGKKFYFKKERRSYLRIAGNLAPLLPFPGGGAD